MADENNAQTVTKQEHVEVIDAPGQTNAGVKALSSMFDRIAEGKGEGKTAEEVVAEQPKVEPKAEPKAAVKVEVKEEKVSQETSDLNKKLDETQKKKSDDDEISREKLREEFEAKKEEKKEVKEEKKDDDLPEEELQANEKDKPKTAQRIKQLWKKVKQWEDVATTTKKEAEEKALKLADLEKKLSEVKTVDPETDEKIKAKLDELAMLRRRYELDKDPEVKTKFDSRVESAEKAITDTLTRARAGKALLDLIAEEGGWNKFSQSGRTTTIPDGDGGYKAVTSAELADQILQALPLSERKAVESAMMEQIQTKRDRERYFKEEQDKAVQYFKSRDDASQQQALTHQKQVEEAKKAIDEFTNRSLQADWLKDREIPANATPSEKAAAEDHNKYNAKLKGLLKKAVGAKDLPELFDVITDSVRYYDERRTTASLRSEVDRLKSEVQAKQLEINKIKGASRSVPKAGSISTSATESSNGRDNSPKSITDAFDRLTRGERLSTVIVSDDE